MKRTGGLFEQVYDINNLMLAHKNARKGKSFYKEVKMVNENPGKYLYELQDAIKNLTYQTSEYTIFQKQDGEKLREIYKLPYFPDRICQWAIIQVIEPYLLRNLTDDTYSAIPGRGTFKAYTKLKKALRKDRVGTRWCLKLDIKKYYPNISKSKLKDKYARLFKDKRLLALIGEIIDSTEGEKGVPIGNYISQYSGNIYLSDFDHRVKEVYKVKYYFRYMDDMVFLAKTKEELQILVKEVIKYMKEELDLEIKENWSLFEVDDRGIDFVGYVFKHDNIRLRKTIVKTLKRTSLKIKKRVNQGGIINYHMFCAINSMKGWLQHGDCGALHFKYITIIQEHIDYYYENVIKKRRKKNAAA